MEYMYAMRGHWLVVYARKGDAKGESAVSYDPNNDEWNAHEKAQGGFAWTFKSMGEALEKARGQARAQIEWQVCRAARERSAVERMEAFARAHGDWSDNR